MRRLIRNEFITKARDVHGDRYGYGLVQNKNSTAKVCRPTRRSPMPCDASMKRRDCPQGEDPYGPLGYRGVHRPWGGDSTIRRRPFPDRGEGRPPVALPQSTETRTGGFDILGPEFLHCDNRYRNAKNHDTL